LADRSTLVIGTRGSPLALRQAHEVEDRLAAALGWDKAQLPLSIIKTTGDAIQDRPLSEAGGKGLFTKELDTALLDGTIDLAVHSAKDLPTRLPDGLVIAGYLPREDVRDAFISSVAESIPGLPRGAVLGSASLRRQAQVRRARPDIEVTLLRGNVGTRLAKVESGAVAATLLAVAGLKRLGLLDRATAILDTDEFLPAVGQGAIAIMTRSGDESTRRLLGDIIDAATGVGVTAERAFLGVLDGSCRTPIAGHARVSDGAVSFRGLVLRPDGSDCIEVARGGPAGEAERIGEEAGRELKARMPAGMLDV
jgi:hydroxymethylbilane synthase